ncbi:MAG: 2-hydroxychromene-2-carboxylate isomerase [Myxococcota bacterium]
MSGRTLRFHFDYLSPYSYLAWQEVPEFAARLGLELEPVPILLAGLLNHHGHKGPGEIPPKRAYIFRDCIRRAETLGVALVPPASHPFLPLLPLRVTSLDMEADLRKLLVTALFRATWAEGRDVSQPEVVSEICDHVGVREAVRRAGRPETKERLKSATERALAEGIFGVPSMLVDGEVFWGTDSFEYLERYLRGDDPVSRADLRAWDAIEPTAVR